MSSSITAVLLFSAHNSAGSDNVFKVQPASAYAHQTAEQVTVGGKSLKSEDETEDAFGKKNNLLKFRVLPVLIVVENKQSKAIDLSMMEVSLVATDGRHVNSVSADEVQALGAPKDAGVSQIPRPLPPLPRKKNPLRSSSIQSRAFAAKVLPPGETASGFFYFEAAPERGDRLYLSGMREAGSTRELMYFEFDLDAS